MERVQGVGRNAILLFAGFLTGLFIWLQFISAPANADAAANSVDNSSIVVEPQISLSQGVGFTYDDVIADTSSFPVLGVDLIPASDNEILTISQRQRLFDASLKYIAPTADDGVRMARSLKFVKDDGDPTNVCGPLSMAILRDAGIVDPYVKIKSFWLLNPKESRKLLDQTFPSDRYDHYRFSTPLQQMDWESFPLKAGDFLYLYAGPGGTFEHMLVVNRVDDEGRAYSVTNHATPDGFVIDEVLLYDPTHPGNGKFYEWTDRRNNKLGTTGLGGFELWRLSKPLTQKNPTDESFARDLDAIMEAAGGDWYVSVKGLNGGVQYDRHADASVDAGSLIKLPVAMLFFKSLEIEGVEPEEYARYLNEEGPGITYEQLLRALFKKSSLSAAKSLLSEARLAGLNVDETLNQWGLKNTNLDFGKSSAGDLATLYSGLYSGTLVDPSAMSYILNLMNEAGSNKTTRLGVLQKTNPSSLKYYNYRGSILDTIVAIGDSALVLVPAIDGEDSYIVVLMGFPGDNDRETDQDLIAAIEDMTKVFWSYAQK